MPLRVETVNCSTVQKPRGGTAVRRENPLLTFQIPSSSYSTLVQNVDLAQTLLSLNQIRRGGDDELRLALGREKVSGTDSVFGLKEVLGLCRKKRRIPIICH